MPIRIVEDKPKTVGNVRIVQDGPPKTSQSLGAFQGLANVVGNYGKALPRNFQALPNLPELAGIAGQAIVGEAEKRGYKPGKIGRFVGELVATAPTMVVNPVAGGAAQGLLTREGKRGDLANALMSAGTGAALGKVGDVGAKAVAKALTPAVKKVPIKPLEELQKVKDAAYDAVEKTGAKYAPQSLQNAAQSIRQTIGSQLDPDLHSNVVKVLKNIEDRFSKGPLSIKEVDNARQFVSENLLDKQRTDAERRFGKIIKEGIDDFVNSAGPTDVVGGRADDAANAINTARDMNTRFKKSEEVFEALEMAANRAGASGSGGNIDNATRQQMRRVLETTKNLSDQEKEILTAIVRGEKLSNVLRMVGKFSPTSGGLPAWLNLFATSVTGPLGLATAVVGAGAKTAADRMTQGRTQDLLRVMQAGGKVNPNQLTPDQLRRIGRTGAFTAAATPSAMAEALKGNQ
jgi:hypothetical protein